MPERPDREVEFLETLERRRNQSDTIAWTVPGLAVAAEAFLLTVALRPETEPAGRFVAALAGAIVIFAALRLLWKSVFNFDLWDAWINEQRRKLRLRGVRTRDDLLANARSLPPGEAINRRGYQDRWLRYWMIVRLPASEVWIWALRGLLVINFVIALDAFLDWTGWGDLFSFDGDSEHTRDDWPPGRGFRGEDD